MTGFDVIILDFDGTFTDVDREAIPFLARYREGLAEIVGCSIEKAWERSLEAVRRAPDAHGYRFEGRIVAPSHADPYILASCVLQLVMRELGHPEDLPALEPLFHDSYAHADTVFRPDAREVAEAVLALGVPVYVVSNSRTDHVVAKLGRLADGLLERIEVRGDARKFELVAASETSRALGDVAETLDVPGLDRPIYLRRGHYHDALVAIWRATATTPERTLVCGDIFELDLALPAALGASVHLVGRVSTPPWERDAVVRAGGTFSTDLGGLLARL